jgi:hypothetical protein
MSTAGRSNMRSLDHLDEQAASDAFYRFSNAVTGSGRLKWVRKVLIVAHRSGDLVPPTSPLINSTGHEACCHEEAMSRPPTPTVCGA